jgi:TPP-dependent pyruvate/acetoin dehydrogenase alpha subunit
MAGLLIVGCSTHSSAGNAQVQHIDALSLNPLEKKVRFAVIGDYGTGSKAEAEVASMVAGWKPDFIITAGDNNYPLGAASTIDVHIGLKSKQF